uniref:Uncharacterized protein n=1 Tax=Anopheles melas TaxID=34690 RepID=A0A182TL09_9DIPT
MMIDVREQTMLTEHPPTTEEDLHYSKQITSNSRIQSPTMSSVPPTTPPSLQSSPSPQSTSTTFWSEMSSSSATLPVTPMHMAAVPLPSSLTVSAESLIRDVTSAVTEASTHSLPEAVAMHGADPGPMVTTYTAPSSARASPSGTLLGGVSSDSASTAAQYGGSNAYNKYTTFRPCKSLPCTQAGKNDNFLIDLGRARCITWSYKFKDQGLISRLAVDLINRYLVKCSVNEQELLSSMQRGLPIVRGLLV